MKRLFCGLALALTVGACATPAAYAPPPFAEIPIEEGRYRITFQGRGDPAWANDQVLLRASELALQGGYEWFVIDGRHTDVAQPSGSGPHVSIGGSSFSFGRRSGSSVGLGVGFDLSQLAGGGRPRVISSAEVRFGRGPRPEGAYDARDVARTIGGRMGPGYGYR